MLVSHFFDLVPIWLLLIATIVIMIAFIEIGFSRGRFAQSNAKKAQTSQVRAIMGAGLGLLAFMLAFTFNTAQTHFEVRMQSLAEEARIARNAYLQADLLAEPRRTQAKELLRDYTGLRSNRQKFTGPDVAASLKELIQESEQIQQQLWILATHSYVNRSDDQFVVEDNGLFMSSVLALSDIHYTRVHSAIMNRIPLTIWMTLYFMAALSMIIMGYQAGLTGRRSPLATLTLAVAFSAVITLITDLDRPVMSLFEIDLQLLAELHEFMEADLGVTYLPGDQG
jgi:hypothetical protein